MEIVLSSLNLQVTLTAVTLDHPLFTTLLHAPCARFGAHFVPAALPQCREGDDSE